MKIVSIINVCLFAGLSITPKAYGEWSLFCSAASSCEKIKPCHIKSAFQKRLNDSKEKYEVYDLKSVFTIGKVEINKDNKSFDVETTFGSLSLDVESSTPSTLREIPYHCENKNGKAFISFPDIKTISISTDNNNTLQLDIQNDQITGG